MIYLKERHGYTSLKMQYMMEQFPALGGNQDSEGGFGNIIEAEAAAEDVDDECANKVANLSDLNVLKQKLTEAEDKLRVEQNLAKVATRKLEHVEKVASQRIVESMPGANFEEDSNHLPMLLATVLQGDDFEYDMQLDKIEPKSDSEFLKRIAVHCTDTPDNAAKLTSVRNKVLEKMKRTVRRERKLSTSGSTFSVSSRSSSITRQRSEEDENDGEQASKHSRQGHDRRSKLPAPNPV